MIINWAPAAVFGAIMTIGLISSVVKETIFYRFVEYTLLGFALGYFTTTQFKVLFDLVWTGRLAKGFTVSNCLVIIPVIIGLLFYARYFAKVRAFNRWPMSIMAGINMGTFASGQLGIIYSNVVGTVLLGTALGADPSKIVFLVGTITVLSYFIFTREHKGPLGWITKVGRYFIMIGLGATLSAAVVGKGIVWTDTMMRIFYDFLGFNR